MLIWFFFSLKTWGHVRIGNNCRVCAWKQIQHCCNWSHRITLAYENRVYITCFGAGPAGIRTIFDVTSRTLSQTGKFEFDFSFSGHRWSLTPEQGARFVTKIKWFFPFDPYSTEDMSWDINTDILSDIQVYNSITNWILSAQTNNSMSNQRLLPSIAKIVTVLVCMYRSLSRASSLQSRGHDEVCDSEPAKIDITILWSCKRITCPPKTYHLVKLFS